jgi:NADH:ubiquinone oxidoreductase subunit K
MDRNSQPIQEQVQEPTDQNMIDKKKLFWFIFAFVVILAAAAYGIYTLVSAGPETTSQVRDIFIIVLAFESLVIGVALVIMSVQLALLTNMLQTEIKPILSNTKETIDTVKGTADFLSRRAVQPVIKANSYMAGARKLFQMLGIIK